MGCISSKFVTRSISFHEGKNQSLQRTANGIPVREELNISCNGGDHYLAVVHTANMVVNKLQSRDFTSNTCSKPDIEPVRTESINTWELMASLDQGVVKHAQPAPKRVGSVDIDLTRRSKSYHWFPKYEVSSLALEISDGTKEEKSYWSYKGMARSRSIHTVEEYDAMLENIRSSVQKRWLDGKNYGSGTNTQLLGSKASSNISHRAEGKEESGLLEMKQSCLPGEALVYGNNTDNFLRSETETKEVMPSPDSYSSSSGQENQEVIPSPRSSSPTKKSHIFEGAAQEGSISERRLKRKVIAKGLESLRIPPTFEFPESLSLREWLHVGVQVYSPGSYITPKFGSYSLPIRGTVSQSSEDFIFNPELVATYEQCMHQLEAEEESVLKQIVESSDEDCTKDEQAKQEILSHREDCM